MSEKSADAAHASRALALLHPLYSWAPPASLITHAGVIFILCTSFTYSWGMHAFFLPTAVFLSSLKETLFETVILCPYVTFVVMFRIISPNNQRLLPKSSSLFLSVPRAFFFPQSSIRCGFKPSSRLSIWNLSLSFDTCIYYLQMKCLIYLSMQFISPQGLK